ncbi:RHS repeat-associated core domain protein-containing protein [Pseudomonas sp. GM78]|uniref:RHS repeat-associated core domain-containing protein n=1 Tax=Pseudomonas sp. GM78 TaxID=1144337 RepID=UPI000270C159|nr:RHS repeat-associated core domain-containing protein [Pseudomonas sp. GM78]EJN26722.1 RHS repeat-associated core domain protein-containing protein [Pseudomonas sp. GM78]
MPMSPRETLLCRYRYDPLDRSIDWAPDQQASIQRFHCKNRLATEIQGAAKCSVLQHGDQVLAQQRHTGDKVDTALLATDQQRSVLNALDATQPHALAYTPYGHRPLGNGLLSLLGFNGERPDPVTGHYHLGNGYRQFNPTLMRFNSPDSWSPFREGGVNAYMYCGADPINRSDPTGHSFLRLLTQVSLELAKPKKPAETLALAAAGALTFSGAAVGIAGGITNNKDMLTGGLVAAGAFFTLSTIAQSVLMTFRIFTRPPKIPRRLSQPAPPPPPNYESVMELDVPPPNYSSAMENYGPPPSYDSVNSPSQTPTRQRSEKFPGTLNNSLQGYISIRRST